MTSHRNDKPPRGGGQGVAHLLSNCIPKLTMLVRFGRDGDCQWVNSPWWRTGAGGRIWVIYA